MREQHLKRKAEWESDPRKRSVNSKNHEHHVRDPEPINTGFIQRLWEIQQMMIIYTKCCWIDQVVDRWGYMRTGDGPTTGEKWLLEHGNACLYIVSCIQQSILVEWKWTIHHLTPSIQPKSGAENWVVVNVKIFYSPLTITSSPTPLPNHLTSPNISSW